MDLFRRCMEPVEKVLRVRTLDLISKTGLLHKRAHAVLVQSILY